VYSSAQWDILSCILQDYALNHVKSKKTAFNVLITVKPAMVMMNKTVFPVN